MRKTLALLLTSVSFLVLSGCVSDAELRKQDEAQCMSYGFKPGTTDFANCLQRENLARRYSYPYPAQPYWYGYP